MRKRQKEWGREGEREGGKDGIGRDGKVWLVKNRGQRIGREGMIER